MFAPTKAPEDLPTEGPGSLEAHPLTHSKLNPLNRALAPLGGGVVVVVVGMVGGEGVADPGLDSTCPPSNQPPHHPSSLYSSWPQCAPNAGGRGMGGGGDGVGGEVSGSRSLIIIGLWVVRGEKTWRVGKGGREAEREVDLASRDDLVASSLCYLGCLMNQEPRAGRSSLSFTFPGKFIQLMVDMKRQSMPVLPGVLGPRPNSGGCDWVVWAFQRRAHVERGKMEGIIGHRYPII
eukprot:superscaffoldBa00004897_g19615